MGEMAMKHPNDILKETFAVFFFANELTVDELLYDYQLCDLYFPKEKGDGRNE